MKWMNEHLSSSNHFLPTFLSLSLSLIPTSHYSPISPTFLVKGQTKCQETFQKGLRDNAWGQFICKCKYTFVSRPTIDKMRPFLYSLSSCPYSLSLNTQTKMEVKILQEMSWRKEEGDRKVFKLTTFICTTFHCITSTLLHETFSSYFISPFPFLKASFSKDCC